MSTFYTEEINYWLTVFIDENRLTDAFTVSQFRTQLIAEAKQLPMRGQMAVSFEGVDAVSSQVIGALLEVREIITQKSGKLVLCKLNSNVQDLLRVTKLDRFFTTSDSLSAVVGKRKSNIARAGSRDVDWMG